MTRTAPLYAYETLGVRPTDDFETIRAAWRKLVRQHHPDLATGCRQAATARLAEINDAWDALAWHRKRSSEAAEAERRAAREEEARAERRREAARARAMARAEARARAAALLREELAAEARIHAEAELAGAELARRLGLARARRRESVAAQVRGVTRRYASALEAFDGPPGSGATDLCA